MFQFKNQQFVPAGLGILPLIVALAGMVAEAGQSQPKVPVYVRNDAGVPYLVRHQAQGIASQIFAQVGVNIEWNIDQLISSSQRFIFIELTTKTPETFQPRALAYAEPFEEAHVVVLLRQCAKRGRSRDGRSPAGRSIYSQPSDPNADSVNHAC
jgi:hypothetical protein